MFGANKQIIKLCNKRLFSSTHLQQKIIAEHLKNRCLIRVFGVEVAEFLQGLITNNISHLCHGAGSMYTMFLNTKGRVLYDTLIYRPPEPKTFLIECDTQLVNGLEKHLKMYCLRRKIDITNLKDDFKIYAVFNTDQIDRNNNSNQTTELDSTLGHIIPCTFLQDGLPESTLSCKVYRDLFIYRDPRTAILGSRVIAPVKAGIQQQILDVFNVDINIKPERSYQWFRYNLGIGEGVSDLPSGDCFPLENNCDYLHGVSFHKGCYIGQELTARTHHTGVVRKRLMPLYFSKIPTQLPEENKIVHENTNLGKLRGVEDNVGLALLRITQALQFSEIKVGDGVATTEKPKWWPLEAPKEKISVQKS